MNQPEQETLQDLAAAYALGALSAEEASRFEAYLAGSAEAQREVAEYRWVDQRSLATAVAAAPWAFSPWLVLQARELELFRA